MSSRVWEVRRKASPSRALEDSSRDEERIRSLLRRARCRHQGSLEQFGSVLTAAMSAQLLSRQHTCGDAGRFQQADQPAFRSCSAAASSTCSAP